MTSTLRRGALAVVLALALGGSGVAALAAPSPSPSTSSSDAPQVLSGSLSSLSVSGSTLNGTVSVGTGDAVRTVDSAGLVLSVSGRQIPLKVTAAQGRSTILLVDTSGSMRGGMATMRAAVGRFAEAAPKDVRIGVVSFANTAGVELAPTLDRAALRKVIGKLEAGGETALWDGVISAVKTLAGADNPSIVLIADGEDSVAANAVKARAQALDAVTKGKVRVQVIGFPSKDAGHLRNLEAFAKSGGGTVTPYANAAKVDAAFAGVAKVLSSEVGFTATLPPGVTGTQLVEVSGSAGGSPFTAQRSLVVGPAAATPTPSATTKAAAPAPAVLRNPVTWALYAAIAAVFLGLVGLVLTFAAPSFQSQRKARVAAIELYGLQTMRERGRVARQQAISGQLIDLGDKVMSSRSSTSKTVALLDQADLPWRPGEWFVLRVVAVIVGVAGGLTLFASASPVLGLLAGLLVGFLLPSAILRFLAKRRAST